MRRTVFDHEPDGLRKRLRDMERQIADLQRVRNPPPHEGESQEDEISWSTGTTVAVAVGDRKSFARDVTVVEFRIDLKGTISGTYTARLLLNGSAISGSSISRTSAGCSFVAITAAVDARPTDYIEAEITAVGTGATGMTLTAVYY